VHVTLRATGGTPYLRAEWPFRAVRAAIAHASRDTFRVVHFSVQGDHLHLLVEASGTGELSRGMQGLAIRVARRVNGAIGRRGAIWADRWHGRALRTPREVRNALVYVISNFKKHEERASFAIDPFSSAAWLVGWADAREGELAALREAHARDSPEPPVRRPRTWLAAVGWLRWGRLSVTECPLSRGSPATTTTSSSKSRGDTPWPRKITHLSAARALLPQRP
jgi:REP element-mobilizing transposase RayT